ncbi:hypothetical protein [Frankia sp. R82]|uniref:hypothetical protein n=1 Tax=Frankia sp. R82 TaxID=2950553 RepID=UPI002042D7D7|nr:hypothetical protein [Frankia sp. R82]MCM3884180.1 hypothetical protein [Frankia sp. R82]
MSDNPTASPYQGDVATAANLAADAVRLANSLDGTGLPVAELARTKAQVSTAMSLVTLTQQIADAGPRILADAVDALAEKVIDIADDVADIADQIIPSDQTTPGAAA